MFALALLASVVASMRQGPYEPPARTWFPIAGDAGFSNVREELQILVDEKAHRTTNRFCVVGSAAGRYRSAYVHWPQENKLILWEPQDTPRAMIRSRRYLDLKDDVVKGDDVGTSTYMITRSEAKETIDACRRVGARYVVTRRSPQPKGS